MVGIPTAVRSRLRSATYVAGLCAATALLALAGCGSGGTSAANGSYGFPEAKQETSSTITVWVDADRQAAAKAFQQANPDTKVQIVSYDGSANGSNSFRTKMQLFDRADSGWPDVVFSTQNNDAAWASQKSGGKQAFAAVLDKVWFLVTRSRSSPQDRSTRARSTARCTACGTTSRRLCSGTTSR